MKSVHVCTLVISIGIFILSLEAVSQSLDVSENGRFLVKSDGSPFVWLGDTAWELFHRLNQEEANIYLENRTEKGFNVIQAVVLAEFDGLNTPNAYGETLLINNNPTRPNEAYFEHVDYIMTKADQLGLYMAILPSWREWVTPRIGEFIFNGTSDAYVFGHYLGKRYRSFHNIIWVLGGDRLPNERQEGVAIWRAMAEGITDGGNDTDRKDLKADYSSKRMTYRCYAPSTEFFQDDAWIDFHSWGSYHSASEEERAHTVAHEMWKEVNAPIINLELAYEMIPKNYEQNARADHFEASDVRRHAYWSVFAGAFGHTYGAHPIWQMYSKEVGLRSTYTPLYWEEALDLEGAYDMQHIKNLLQSRPRDNRVPGTDMVVNNNNDSGHLEAFKGDDFAMFYSPEGNDFQVKKGIISGAIIKAWWFIPRNGTVFFINEYKNKGELTFYPLGEPAKGNDWVLVLDNSEVNFLIPGN